MKITHLFRAGNSKIAGPYCGLSASHMNNLRYEDQKRKECGEEPLGPKYYHRGRQVIYFREDLDVWLDAIKSGNHPLARQKVYRDTSGLKHPNYSETDTDEHSSDLV